MNILIDGIPYGPIFKPAPPGVASLPTGRIIRQARKAHRWTLDDLARKSGLSKAFLSELENGKREPSLRTAAALADALGVGLDDLAAGLDG